MNMALQKFAHGATHYCKFKHTALCENALHYDNKTTINKQILCRFQIFFFQKSKNWNPHSIVRYFAPSQVDLWAETLPFSAVLPLENTQTSSVAIFSHSWASSSFKGAAPRVLWEKVISRRSKELKSDPRSCPLVRGPCWKFGWRHHISSSGCGPDCTGFFSKTTEFMGLEFFIYLFIYLFFISFVCLYVAQKTTPVLS